MWFYSIAEESQLAHGATTTEMATAHGVIVERKWRNGYVMTTAVDQVDESDPQWESNADELADRKVIESLCVKVL